MATSTHMLRARELRADGWTYQAIGTELGIAKNTAARYCDPAYAARHLAKNRQWAGTQAHTTTPSADFLLGRARVLNEAGISFRSIATLYAVDYGVALSEAHILAAVRTGRWPKQLYRVTCQSCQREFGSGKPETRWCSSGCRAKALKAAAYESATGEGIA